MKIYVDNEKTMGNEVVFRNVTDWKDFNTKKIIGKKINVVAIENDFEKIAVKIEGDVFRIDEIASGDKVGFTDLNGTVYTLDSNGRSQTNVSFKATGVYKV